MDLNKSTVERNGFYFKAEYLLLLKAFKYTIKNPVLAPAVHACVDAMSATEVFWQTAPLAPMFRNVQNRVQHLEVVKVNIAPLAREAVSNSLILFASNLHKLQLHNTRILSNSVNTP